MHTERNNNFGILNKIFRSQHKPIVLNTVADKFHCFFSSPSSCWWCNDFYGYALLVRMPFELMKWLFVTGGLSVSPPNRRIQIHIFFCSISSISSPLNRKYFIFPRAPAICVRIGNGNWSVLWAEPCAKPYKLWILQANKAIRARLSARIETRYTQPLLLIDNKLPIQCARAVQPTLS